MRQPTPDSACARRRPRGSGPGEAAVLRPAPGGTATVRRAGPPLPPAPPARARTPVLLDARLVGRRPGPALAEGSSLFVRGAGPQDRAAALEMHGRCSPATLALRYPGPVADTGRYLAHLLGPRFGRSLAVETAAGRLVALGHLLWDGGESEVTLLVEDAWQRRGVGGQLLRRLVGLAAAAGHENVYAVTRPANTAMVATMRDLRLPLDHQVQGGGTLVITAALPATGGAAGGPRW